METTKNQLGTYIRENRKKIGLTQKDLAQGICAQSMISGLEKGNYMPNAELLSAIFKRLDLSMDVTMLANFFQINQFDFFNQEVERLCRAHEYAALVTYIEQSGIEDQLEDAYSLQVYYYYHACGLYQSKQDKALAISELKMVLAETATTERRRLTTIERMLFSALGLMIDTPAGKKYFSQAFHGIKPAAYSENHNILFYQYAYYLVRHQEIDLAIETIKKGISFITQHDSHYMLTNLFYLLWRLTTQPAASQVAKQQYQVMANLFNEAVYQPEF